MKLDQLVRDILKSRNIPASDENDIQDVFMSMSEIFEAVADAMEKEVPYATKSIRQMRETASELNDYDYFLERYDYNYPNE